MVGGAPGRRRWAWIEHQFGSWDNGPKDLWHGVDFSFALCYIDLMQITTYPIRTVVKGVHVPTHETLHTDLADAMRVAMLRPAGTPVRIDIAEDGGVVSFDLIGQGVVR